MPLKLCTIVIFCLAWLLLTFYPIENGEVLLKMRAELSDFLRHVRTCHDDDLGWINKNQLVDNIIETASSYVHPHIIYQLHGIMRGSDQEYLRDEHELLRNMNIWLD